MLLSWIAGVVTAVVASGPNTCFAAVSITCWLTTVKSTLEPDAIAVTRTTFSVLAEPVVYLALTLPSLPLTRISLDSVPSPFTTTHVTATPACLAPVAGSTSTATKGCGTSVFGPATCVVSDTGWIAAAVPEMTIV